MSDAPERIITRHYANGIINAAPADRGFSLAFGNAISEAEYLRADIAESRVEALQAENARLRAAPKVKPRVWEFFGSGHVRAYAFYAYYEVMWEFWNDKACLRVHPHIMSPLWYENPEAAKAAAQADYERRILGALE